MSRPLSAGDLQADEFCRLARQRTGLAGKDLQCPREKSAMTPCIARDGHLAVAEALGGDVCVGCEHRVETLLERERERHPRK
jgi:hypothetical protein